MNPSYCLSPFVDFLYLVITGHLLHCCFLIKNQSSTLYSLSLPVSPGVPHVPFIFLIPHSSPIERTVKKS